MPPVGMAEVSIHHVQNTMLTLENHIGRPRVWEVGVYMGVRACVQGVPDVVGHLCFFKVTLEEIRGEYNFDANRQMECKSLFVCSNRTDVTKKKIYD